MRKKTKPNQMCLGLPRWPSLMPAPPTLPVVPYSEDKVSVDHFLPSRNSSPQLLPALPVYILSGPLCF